MKKIIKKNNFTQNNIFIQYAIYTIYMILQDTKQISIVEI